MKSAGAGHVTAEEKRFPTRLLHYSDSPIKLHSCNKVKVFMPRDHEFKFQYLPMCRPSRDSVRVSYTSLPHVDSHEYQMLRSKSATHFPTRPYVVGPANVFFILNALHVAAKFLRTVSVRFRDEIWVRKPNILTTSRYSSDPPRKWRFKFGHCRFLYNSLFANHLSLEAICLAL
jgi:hypothetical protein